MTQLEHWIAQQINTKGDPEDSWIIISVNAEQVQGMRIYGKNELDKEELSGQKSTLIL